MTYQINDLERITGIKAHTIRIWERRFGLVKPLRTPTNIRCYDDADVRHLLNVSTLMQQGYKISQLAGLPGDHIRSLVLKLYDEQTGQTSSLNPVFVNDLIVAASAFDEAAFEKVFSAAVIRMGMYEAMLKVVYPFLERAGVLWCCEGLTPLQEHFASNIIRRKLLSAIDGFTFASRRDKSFLLLLPPGEWHEIPLLFSDYLIRASGYPTVYLGQSINYDELPQAIEKVAPTHVLTFFISTRDNASVSQLVSGIRNKCGNTHLLIGGHREVAINSTPGISFLHDPLNLLKHLSTG